MGLFVSVAIRLSIVEDKWEFDDNETIKSRKFKLKEAILNAALYFR